MASVKINDSLRSKLRKECVNNLDEAYMKDIAEMLVKKFMECDTEKIDPENISQQVQVIVNPQN